MATLEPNGERGAQHLVLRVGERDVTASAPVPTEWKSGGGEVDSLWIGSGSFRALAQIHESNAREALAQCHAGGTWRGQALQVRKVDSQGGQSGKAYQVYVPSLPDALRKAWLRQHPELTRSLGPQCQVLAQADQPHPRLAKAIDEWQWRLSIIALALTFRKGSAGRGQVVRDMVAKTHTRPDGTAVKLSSRTLHLWIEKVEAGGEFALARKLRRPEAQPRHRITRQWDAICPLAEAQQAEIAAEFDAYLRGLWVKGVASGDKCAAMASSKLLELCHAAGWADATLEQCTVGRNRAERFKDARIVAIKAKDATRFTDSYVPRIRRSREGLAPLDIVVGDVHPVDVVINRPDGSQATPRLIAWLDSATNDIFCSLVLLNPGEGIKQAHIAASFVDMVQEWGLPRSLYLDNGSEYKWAEMMNAFRELTGLTHAMDVFLKAHGELVDLFADDAPDDDTPEIMSDAVTRAKPHNPPAKAVEGIFSALEKVLSMIDGYIGGDRMNKRTHARGKAPKPFPGSFEDFERQFADALAFYRNTPQRGSLGGRSPRQVWQQAIEAGFTAYRAQVDLFRYAFAEDVRPKVQTGGVQVGGRWYYHDVLLPLIGQRVSLRYPKWDPRHVIYVGKDRQAVFIPVAQVFQTFDRAGAIEQSRREGALKRYVKSQAVGAAPLELMDEVARHNLALGPMPEVPKGANIALSLEMQTVLEAGKQAELPAPRRLASDEFVHAGTGEVFSMLPQLPPVAVPKPVVPDMWEVMQRREAELQARKKEKSDKAATLPDLDQLMVARYGNR